MNKKIIPMLAVGFFLITMHGASAQAGCNPATLKTVQFGQRSTAVANMQACLIQNKYEIVEGATGLYGRKTVQLVKRFYKDNKMAVTGKVFGVSGIRIMQKISVPAPVVNPVAIPTPIPTPIPTQTPTVPATSSTPVQDDFTCGQDLTYGGVVYRTTKIGDNCWFKDNVNKGGMIAGGTSPKIAGVVEKYCYGDDVSNCSKFGGLYTWAEAMDGSTLEKSQGICPGGWHIPTLSEWGSLYEEAGVPKADANSKTIMYIDSTGNTFAKLIGLIDGKLNGFRFTNGAFYSMAKQTFFWTSDQLSDSRAYAKYLINEPYNITIGGDSADKKYGMSVRCVKSDQDITLRGFGY